MPVVRGLRRIADVSPMITHEAGAGPRVNSTETIRPSDACARDAASDMPKQAAIPRAKSRTVLTADPQR